MRKRSLQLLRCLGRCVDAAAKTQFALSRLHICATAQTTFAVSQLCALIIFRIYVKLPL